MNALTRLDAPTRNVVITTNDGAALAEALFGGLASTRCASHTARTALVAARRALAIVRRRRGVDGPEGYRFGRTWALARVARCRAAIARCEARIRELQE